MTNATWARAAAYAVSKIAAAGLVYWGFIFIVSGRDYEEMRGIGLYTPVWLLIFVYAILFSMTVDAILCKLKAGPGKTFISILIYMAGGYAPFIIMFQSQWILGLIAGFYGICCSLAFLCASYILRRLWPASAGIGLLLLAGIVYLFTTAN
ncbi:hypothetical protein [Paenibacillus sp. PL2-23]|uniref:hypothetical protein n=1 Tax=Paenibacillus sp. PL2-23 TaxID=2100729 RepID=UPI0030F6539C